MIETLSLKEIAPLINRRTLAAVKRRCAKYQLPIHSDGNDSFVITLDFVVKRFAGFITYLQKVHGDDWSNALQVYMDGNLAQLVEIENNLKVIVAATTPTRLSRVHTEYILSTSPNQYASYDDAVGKNKKPYVISSTQQIPGFTIWCNVCKTTIRDTCRHTGKILTKCSYPEALRYKEHVHVSGTKNSRKTLTFKALSIEAAIKRAMEFREQVKQQHVADLPNVITPTKLVPPTEAQQSPLFIDAVTKFMSVMRYENVPKKFVNERGDEYLRDFEYSLNLIPPILQPVGFDPNTLRLSDIDDDVAGIVVGYLQNEKKYAGNTFNRYLTNYRRLYQWAARKQRDLYNPFANIRKKKGRTNKEIIEPEKFKRFIASIDRTKALHRYGNSRPVYLYTDFLVPGFKLLLLTGVRLNEAAYMRFCDIVDEADGGYIKNENIKVNKIQGLKEDDEKVYSFPPLIKSLRKFLTDELNWEQYRNSDKYILAPESNRDRDGIAKALSKGFTHYYRLFDPDHPLSVKCLRKTNFTYLGTELSTNLKHITGHASDKTLDDHYFYKIKLAKRVSQLYDLPQFLTEPNRSVEELRNQLNEIQTNKTLEL